MVHKRETKELAETVAKSVTGVKMVDNDLTLASTEANPSKTDAVTKEAEAELKDTVLETEVRIALVDKLGSDGFDISTEVASGVVTLAFHKDFVAAHRTEAQNIVKGVKERDQGGGGRPQVVRPAAPKDRASLGPFPCAGNDSHGTWRRGKAMAPPPRISREGPKRSPLVAPARQYRKTPAPVPGTSPRRRQGALPLFSKKGSP